MRKDCRKKRMTWAKAKQIAAAIVCLGLVAGCTHQPHEAGRNLSELFTAPANASATVKENWTAALSPRTFAFPQDHGAHEDYRIEWWYYTGNLEADNGRRFGYQLTFFRTGLRKDPQNPSRWSVRDLYTAHFAVSDLDREKHYCFQRNSRRGLGQADAKADRYEVWNGHWKVWQSGEDHRLRAANSDVSIDLTLTPTKPIVLHGEQGLSQKGPSAGNASYYYSLTRLATTGQIQLGDKTLAVQGQSWMDHEFSTSFLEPGQLGWDWLAIQLDDGEDLMLYRMRREDGSTDPFSSGSLVSPTGDLRHLSVDDFAMTPLGAWESPQTGAQYPLTWKVQLSSLGYELEIRPAFAAQEMTTEETTGINYWEGAIVVSGRRAEDKVSGRGYMELTGYAGQGLGSLLE